MSARFWLRGGRVVLVGLIAANCGRTLVNQPPTARPQTAPVAVAVPAPGGGASAGKPAPQPDPIDALIARSQDRFDAGAAELKLGHLSKAKTEFNAALDLLLEFPAGVRSNRKLQDHFDRLVDRISAFEIRSLAEGDGFVEKPTVPASLDELLAQPTPESPTPRADILAIVTADLANTVHDVPIPLNDKVLSYIEVFQGRLREWFQISLQRGMTYLPMIQNVFRSEGLPLDLAYIPIVESAFRTDALSRASARGFWQLMRGTATEQGLTQNWYIDERSNPEKATAAAAKYLKMLSKMFNGDWHLALASYNGGPGFMQRTVAKKGQADFWKLSAGRSTLPRETREYVPMVLASIVIARNPTHYGFTFEPVAPPEYETVTLPGPADLRRIAEWAGVAVDDIKGLNPELRRGITPVGDESYVLRVPRGTAKLVEQRVAEVSPEDLAPLQSYTVRRGETLTTIANKLRVRRTDLAEANNLKLRATVTTGQKLVVPFVPATLLTSPASRPDTPPEPPPTARVPAPAHAAPTDADRVKVTYVVKKGDTLSSISQRYHATPAMIRSWNGLKSDRIVPGERLTIYTIRPRGSASH